MVKSGPAVMLTRMPLAPDRLTSSSSGFWIAASAAACFFALLAAMRAHPLGAEAAIIGRVHEDAHHFVQMTTGLGGKRIDTRHVRAKPGHRRPAGSGGARHGGA